MAVPSQRRGHPLFRGSAGLVVAIGATILSSSPWAQDGGQLDSETPGDVGGTVEPLSATPAEATSPSPSRGNKPTELPEIAVRGRAEDILGVAAGASEGAIGEADLKDLPLLRRGEIMETVPGMVVTQHSGDGKANQYFLRGFNLDHGTDFAFSVDGVPVNLPSHAHGQGYSDLNFMIPELVNFI